MALISRRVDKITQTLSQLDTLTKGLANNNRATFNKLADQIIAEWFRRKARPADRRAESANAWFKRAAYQLLQYYIEHGMQDTFERNFRQDERPNRLVEAAKANPFKAGLLAMFSDDTLSRNDRHVFGNQMLYAWAHQVPPDFLNAFLAVSGGPAQIANKLRDQQPEPGFEHRFIANRLPG